MRNKHLTTMVATPVLLALLLPGAGTSSAAHTYVPAQAPTNFADPAFRTTWTPTDALVDDGTIKRSFYWGPLPGFSMNEDYDEGPGGKHLVQYFDKSRMEVNNPNGDRNNPFFVTNGLLTVELISGQMQVGNTRFVNRYPAEIDIASDTDDLNAPTYASFRSVTYDYYGPSKLGQTINDTINRVGLTGTDSRYDHYGIKYVYFEPATKHNIPDVFWNFLNVTGPVMVNGKQVNARLSDPYFYATG